MPSTPTPASPLSRPIVLPAPEGSVCLGCAAHDDGPHGKANVPADVEIDFVQLCTKCALANGATYREIAAALGVLSCDSCCEQLDVQDAQVTHCPRCALLLLSAEHPVVAEKAVA